MREPFRKARVYITTLLVIEIVLGALILATTGIYHHVLGTYLAETERRMLTGQLFNTYLLGFQVIATYLGSVFMWNSIWLRPRSPNICLLLSVWMFFTFLILICACATMWTLYVCAHAIHATAEASLSKGIDLYYTCPEWKLLWDGLQFYRECCGVYSYMDWMKASWMPGDALGSDGGGAPEQCGGEKKTAALAPYACCKHSCNACFENYIPRYGNTGIPFLNLTQINTNGCLPLFEGSMWECIHILMAFVCCSIFIDIMMCCITRMVIRHQGTCEFTGEDQNDDEDQPLIVPEDQKDTPINAFRMRPDNRETIRTKIDRRLVNQSKSMQTEQRTRNDMTSDGEAEHRACLRSEMEKEERRRTALRSEMEAEAERRASIRARMDAERMSNMRSQWNAQRRSSQRPEEWNSRQADMDQQAQRQSVRPLHSDACDHRINCSGCTQVRNINSGESRFVH